MTGEIFDEWFEIVFECVVGYAGGSHDDKGVNGCPNEGVQDICGGHGCWFLGVLSQM